MPEGVSPDVFKNAINLNRYSNGVAKKIVVAYNRIVLDATKELLAMDAHEYSASYRTKRLRRIIGSLKTSLDGWAGRSSKLMKKELTDLAEVEAEFAMAQLLQQVPGADDLIREISIGEDFAEAVVETDPTDLNLVTLSDDLEEKVKGRRRATYSLGAKEGTPISLPNGDSLGKAFRGLSTKSAQKFRLVVQDGLLTGETTNRIVRNLIGSQGGMDFGTGFEMVGGEITKKGVRQIAQAGGPYLTRMANHQVMTLVRTSINQVSNVASQKTYQANREITDKFMFVATLDSRTSLTCAAKDGKEYSYDDGPVPPLHFNCRSTTVAVPNWKSLEEKYGIERPKEDAIRASKTGPVPAGERYGDWLDKQPLSVQEEALGKRKANYFNQLVRKYKKKDLSHAGDLAITKLISTDGTEKTLGQIAKEYKLRKRSFFKSQAVLKKEELAKTPTMGALQGFNRSSKIDQADLDEGFKLMTEMEGEAGKNARKLVEFAEKREVFATWSTGRELTRRGTGPGYGYLLKNPQFERSLKKGLARKNMGYKEGVDKLLIGRVHEKMKGALSLIEGKEGKFLDKNAPWNAFTMWRNRGAEGYTMLGSNHIVMRNNSRFRKISNLKDIIKSIKEGVRRAGAKQIDLSSMASERFADSPFGISRGSQSWLTTYVHEMGHQVHYAAGKPMLGGGDRFTAPIIPGTYIPSGYGGSNNMEQFAETFVQYIFDPVGLKKVAPEAYSWVDSSMKAALETT